MKILYPNIYRNLCFPGIFLLSRSYSLTVIRLSLRALLWFYLDLLQAAMFCSICSEHRFYFAAPLVKETFKTRSSAYRRHGISLLFKKGLSLPFISSTISFMNILKRRGLSTSPCFPPTESDMKSVLSPFILIQHSDLLYMLWIISNVFPLIPAFRSL